MTPLKTHSSDCPYRHGHDCNCGKKTLTHSNDCGWRHGHDCNCGLHSMKKTKKEEFTEFTIEDLMLRRRHLAASSRVASSEYQQVEAEIQARFQAHAATEDWKPTWGPHGTAKQDDNKRAIESVKKKKSTAKQDHNRILKRLQASWRGKKPASKRTSEGAYRDKLNAIKRDEQGNITHRHGKAVEKK